MCNLWFAFAIKGGWDLVQVVEHSDVTVWILLHGGSILHGRSISLGYFPFQQVVHNWSIKGCGMYCPVFRKVHIKDHLLLIGMSSLCGDNRFCLKKYVTMTICLTSSSRWFENQCALETSLNKTNFPFAIKGTQAPPCWLHWFQHWVVHAVFQ